jgi:DtxR family Mn-dependent transcriptional regulator
VKDSELRAAAIEQFLSVIARLQRQNGNGAPLAAIAESVAAPGEQIEQTLQSLAQRGLVDRESKDSVKLTPFGVRRLLTESIEDYIVSIYRLSRSQEHERVTTSAIAQALGVSAPSVTSMIQRKLAHLGLVEYERHHGVTLTPLGEQVALQILRHHRIVELFLTEQLGLPWDQVHEEAHRLEHAMSPALVERLAAKMGDPLVDPHGDPIPRKDGTVVDADLAPLYEMAPGTSAVVRRIANQSADVLRYLSRIGLVPGTTVTVETRAPLDGPLTLRIGAEAQTISRDLALTILVARA